MTTILVPLDFSDCAEGVAAAARARAQAERARLVFLHVIQIPRGIGADVLVQPDPGGPSLPLGEYMSAKATRDMNDFVRRAKDLGLQAEGRLLEGPVVDTILTVARDVGAGTIVMGTHDRHGVAKLMMGSVSEKVANKTELEVVRIPSQHHAGCTASSCNWCAEAGVFRDQSELVLT